MKLNFEDRDLKSLIPYISHYDDSTILADKGRLISIVKFQSVKNNNFIPQLPEFNAKLRASLSGFTNPSLAWQIRNKRVKSNETCLQLHQGYKYGGFLAQSIMQQYYNDIGGIDLENEIYIVFIYQIQPINFSYINNALALFRGGLTHAKLDDNLSKARAELGETVAKLMSDLALYKPEMLQVKNTPSGTFSEILDFFYQCFRLNTNSLEHFARHGLMQTSQYSLQNNIVKIQNDNQAKYISLFTIKELVPLNQAALASLINSGIMADFIETLVPCNQAPDHIEELNKVVEASGRDIRNLKTYAQAKLDKSQFYQSSAQVIVFADDKDQAQANIAAMAQILDNIGLSYTVEDILLEQMIYSTLPTNFDQLKLRQTLKHSSDIGSMMFFNPYFTGEIINHDQPYICIFKTIYNSNFYFSYLTAKPNYNVLILDAPPSESSRGEFLLNFLTSISLFKFDELYKQKEQPNLQKGLNKSPNTSSDIHLSYMCTTTAGYIFSKILGLGILTPPNLFGLINQENLDLYVEFFYTLSQFDTTNLKVDLTMGVIDDAASNDISRQTIRSFLLDIADNKLSGANDRSLTRIRQEYALNANPNTKILDILDFLCDKYSMIFDHPGSSQTIWVDQNFCLDIRSLTDAEFNSRFYPANDERKLDEFNIQAKFNVLVRAAYIELYIGLVIQHLANKITSNDLNTQDSNSDTTMLDFRGMIILENLEDVFADNATINKVSEANAIITDISSITTEVIQRFFQYFTVKLNQLGFGIMTKSYSLVGQSEEQLQYEAFGHMFDLNVVKNNNDNRLHTINYISGKYSTPLQFNFLDNTGPKDLLVLDKLDCETLEAVIPTSRTGKEILTKFFSIKMQNS